MKKMIGGDFASTNNKKVGRKDSLDTSCLRGNRNDFAALALAKSTACRT